MHFWTPDPTTYIGGDNILNPTIDREYLIKTLTDLVGINSINLSLVPGGRGETEIAAYIAQSLRSLNLEVALHEADHSRVSAVGILKGQGHGRSLMLNGHIDTVGVEGMDNQLMDCHCSRFTLNFDTFAREFIQALPLVLECRVHGRNLFDNTGKSGYLLVHIIEAYVFAVCSSDDFAFSITGVSNNTQFAFHTITLVCFQQKG